MNRRLRRRTESGLLLLLDEVREDAHQGVNSDAAGYEDDLSEGLFVCRSFVSITR